MRQTFAFAVAFVLLAGCSKASTVDSVGAPDGGDPGVLADTAMGGGGAGGAAEGAASGGAGAASGDAALGDAASGDAASGDAASGQGDASPAPTQAGASAEAGLGAAGESPAKDGNAAQPGAPAGKVEFVGLQANGGTSDATLKAALEKARTRYRGCYGKALASDSSTQGTLKLRATIASDGLVEKVEVIGGNLGLSPLVQCSVATTKSLKVTGAAAPATKATFDVKFSK